MVRKAFDTNPNGLTVPSRGLTIPPGPWPLSTSNASCDGDRMDLIELLRRAADSTEAVLARISPADHHRPTPCPEMTVVQVASHLVGGLRAFAVVGEGGSLSFDSSLDPDLVSDAPATVFRSAVDQLMTVFSAPARLEASYEMPWGPTAGSQLVGFELIETVVHGWDIARGLDVVTSVEDEVAQATLDGARMWVDESVRVPGMFGPEVVIEDGSPIDQLVAFLGRDPGWRPHSSDITGAHVVPSES